MIFSGRAMKRRRRSQEIPKSRGGCLDWGKGCLILSLLLFPSLLFAQEGGEAYRSFFGLNPRLVVWIVAELHLMYAAFVLGVPLFAVIVEYIGKRTGDPKYDRLAREFTRLLLAAFSTTAALGGLLAFTLFGLYPKFMGYLTQIFHKSYYVYALLFFAEGFTLYLYYYSWDRLQEKGKGFHIFLGILLNVWGTVLMLIANSWASFMMSPAGVDQETGAFLGSTWAAVANPLWIPLAIHRFIANIAFGGLIAGAYAAVRFLGATSETEKAHYDWMGYVGNFVAIAALIPLPFAGYYLGREVYSASPVMGNNMMGGAFSWTFIIQAILIGILFIGANYYLWIGMGRIAGAERYLKYIKYINLILLICFAVWLTPHNLPLSAAEQLAIGGQYHPVLKWLGLMSAKNAVVNFIILSTFFSFLLYRRANKGRPRPFAEQGTPARVVLLVVGGVCLLFLGAYAYSLFTLDPATLELSPDKARYFLFPGLLLILEIITIFVAIWLTFRDRGLLGQGLLFAVTVTSAVFALGIYGFVIMEKANPFLRNIAVTQFLLVISCLVVNTFIDIFLFQGAEVVGGIQWGKMPARSQYVLVLLCVTVVILMGLMGYIRSGLREDWHVYAIMQDTSPEAYTPTMAYMTRVVGGIVLLFLGSIAFVFWLSGLGEHRSPSPTPLPVRGGLGNATPEQGGTHRSFLGVVIFTVVVVLAFAYLGEVLTRISGEASRGAGGRVAGEAVTPAAGEALFWGKGNCYTCHSIGGRGSAIRGPNLGETGPLHLPIGARSVERARERAGQTGKPFTATDYLLESLVEPGAYVVQGYNNIMPVIWKPPIALKPEEIKAVVLYLQSQGGTVDGKAIDASPFFQQLKATTPTTETRVVEAWKPYLSGDPERGKRLFFDLGGPAGCAVCHKVGEQGGMVGPELTKIAAIQSPQYILESILEPSKVVVPGYGFTVTSLTLQDGRVITGTVKAEDETTIEVVDAQGQVQKIAKAVVVERGKQERSPMPDNFSQRLTVQDLHDLLAFLLTLK
ncbi:MAG: hypothetical protein D6736_10385 [Nitrospinota bacterium]|nr:MAG: hypothetical protein D6736_10385 [Nitrospinota bacterium]